MDMDLVDSFFSERADDENTVETSTNTVDLSLFDKAEPKVKGILKSVGGIDDVDADFIVARLRDDYTALSTDDEGNAADTDLAELTAEVADILSAFATDKSDDDLAIAASDIVTAITNKYALEDSSVESDDESEDTFDDVDNDDVDPTFWD